MMFMAIAGKALQTLQPVMEGRQAEKVADYNAKQLNAAASAQERATIEREGMLRRRNEQGFSAQRVAMLQNGVDAGTGTALIGTEQQLRDAELDAQMERYQGLMQARGLRHQAAMVRYEGKAKRRQAYVSAVAQLLQSAGSYGGGAMGAAGSAMSAGSAASSGASSGASSFGGYGGRY